MARGRQAAAVAAGPINGPWKLPEGWRWERLDTVAPINPRRTLDLPDDTEVAFVPMAAVQELTGGLNHSARRRVAEVRTGYTKFATGDVLFAKITPCMENGKAAIVPELPHGVGAGSTEFHVIHPQELLPEFVFYWVTQQWFRDEAEANMTGTAGQKRVPTDYMRCAPIPVPPPDVQLRIVSRINELFTELDDGEAALARARDDMKTYRKSLLKAAVTGELTADWREANPPQESSEQLLRRILSERRHRWEGEPKNQGKRYKEPCGLNNSELSELPSKWTWASLDQLGWASGYGTSSKCDYDAPGEPVLRIPNLKNGGAVLDDIKNAKKPLHLDVSEYLTTGDLLIVRTNGSRELIGRAGIIDQPFSQNTHFASYLIRFRIIGLPQLHRWIRLFTDSALFRANVLRCIASSAGQYNLSMSNLAQFPIAVPPEAEIAAVLDAVEDNRVELGNSFPVSRTRQAILNAAFRGELVP